MRPRSRRGTGFGGFSSSRQVKVVIAPETGKVLRRGVMSPGGHAGTPGREPYGRLWPHGEWSLGFRQKGQKVDRWTASSAEWADIRDQYGAPREGWLSEAVAALDLPPVPNSHSRGNRPETYGRNGITRFGSRMVKAGAYLLQEAYGPARLTFLTLTCPPMCDNSAKLVAAGWGEIVRQLMQWLTRKLESAGLPKDVVMVTEFQPKRAANGRLESLHLHAVFVGRHRKKGGWAITCAEMKAFWDELLNRVARSAVAGRYWPYMKEVTDSAANYLGKYMSKGATGVGKMAAQWGWDCIPRQWWSMTQPLKARIKARMLAGMDVAEVLDSLVQAYFAGPDQGFPGYLQAVHIDMGSGPVLVGYTGRLNAELLSEATEIVNNGRQG